MPACDVGVVVVAAGTAFTVVGAAVGVLVVVGAAVVVPGDWLVGVAVVAGAVRRPTRRGEQRRLSPAI